MVRLTKTTRILGIIFVLALVAMVAVWGLKGNIYDDRLGINVLLITDEGMGLVGIRAKEDWATVMTLPNNLLVSSSQGDFLVEALWKVGLPKKGLEDVRLGVGRTLGIPLTGVIKAKGGIDLPGLAQSLVMLSSRTNLSLADRLRLAADVGTLLKRGIKLEINLPQSVLDVRAEPDGKNVLMVNPAIYTWAKNQWSSDKVLSETAEVAVVNASGREGIGRIIAHQLETAGVRIIEVSATENNFAGVCVLLGDKKAVPITFTFIRKALNCREGGIGSYQLPETVVKSDLVLVLGKLI